MGMPIVAHPDSGVVLAGEFDRSNPNVGDELKQFEHKLALLQKQLGFEAFIPVFKEANGHVSIAIIPAKATAAGAVSKLGASGDRFTGSGRLVAPVPEGPDPYAEATTQEAGDMLANWFPEEAGGSNHG